MLCCILVLGIFLCMIDYWYPFLVILLLLTSCWPSWLVAWSCWDISPCWGIGSTEHSYLVVLFTLEHCHLEALSSLGYIIMRPMLGVVMLGLSMFGVSYSIIVLRIHHICIAIGEVITLRPPLFIVILMPRICTQSPLILVWSINATLPH